MRRRWRKLAWGLAIAFAAYLVAGNAFLNSAIGPWAINRKPARFQMDWSHGFTWWPGMAVLWNVDARGHVRHVQWSAQAQRAHGRIALLPLLAKELRIPSIRAADVQASVDRVDEDIEPMPYRPGGWSLRFDRIATDSLRGARLGPFALTARGHADFAFFKQLRGGPMEILPSHALLDEVQVALDGTTLLHDARIDASFAIARHRREDAPGLARIALTDASLRIDGGVPGFAAALDGERHWSGRILDAAAGDGSIAANLALRRGELQPGGVLELDLPVRATRAATQVSARANLRADVRDDGVHLAAKLPPPPEGSGSATVDLHLATRRIEPPFDAQAWLARSSGTVELDWQFASLAWLGPLLVKAPWLTLAGAGRLQAALQVGEGRLQPGSRFTVDDVALTAGVAGYTFDGRASVQGRLDDGASEPQAQVDMKLAEYVVRADGDAAPLVKGKDLALELRAAGMLETLRDSMRARLRFRDAQVPDIAVGERFVPRSAVSLLGGRVRVGADLSLAADGRIDKGGIDVAGRRTRLRVGAIDLGGDFDLAARVDGSDIASRALKLDGTTLRLRDIRLVDNGRLAGEQWWANIAFRRGRIEAQQPFTADARADIEMQDVGLLLALFAHRRHFPAWVSRLVDAGSVRANGRVRVEGTSVVLDGIEARNDRFDAKARLRLARAHPRGDLYLGWRALGLGLELDGGKRDFRFVRPAAWYDARPSLLGSR